MKHLTEYINTKADGKLILQKFIHTTHLYLILRIIALSLFNFAFVESFVLGIVAFQTCI